MKWVLKLILPLAMGAAMTPKRNQDTRTQLAARIEEECDIPSLRLNRRDQIGRGSCASVYRDMIDEKIVAIKEVSFVSKHTVNHLDLLLGEILVLKAIRAAGDQAPRALLRSPGCFIDSQENSVGLVMEYLNGIDLDQGLEVWKLRYKRDLAPLHPYSERVIAKVMVSVLEGIQFLHQNGWLHRDIKPSNIMISKRGMVKLIDYGMARPGISSTHPSASPAYASPEVILELEHGAPHDCWCLAATAFEMHTGRTPLLTIPNLGREYEWHQQEGTILEWLNEKLFPQLPVLLEGASPLLADFISRSLRGDPAARLRVDELIEHGFTRGEVASEAELQALVKDLGSE